MRFFLFAAVPTNDDLKVGGQTCLFQDHVCVVDGLVGDHSEFTASVSECVQSGDDLLKDGGFCLFQLFVVVLGKDGACLLVLLWVWGAVIDLLEQTLPDQGIDAATDKTSDLRGGQSVVTQLYEHVISGSGNVMDGIYQGAV